VRVQCLIAIALWSTASITPAAWSDEPNKLEEAMIAEQFRAAGLHRLTAEELAFLNQWLERHASDTSTDFGAEQLPLPQPGATEPTEERTAVVGLFEGWSGCTVFTLANGQVWQQRLPGKYHYKKTENPPVVLIRG